MMGPESTTSSTTQYLMNTLSCNASLCFSSLNGHITCLCWLDSLFLPKHVFRGATFAELSVKVALQNKLLLLPINLSWTLLSFLPLLYILVVSLSATFCNNLKGDKNSFSQLFGILIHFIILLNFILVDGAYKLFELPWQLTFQVSTNKMPTLWMQNMHWW